MDYRLMNKKAVSLKQLNCIYRQISNLKEYIRKSKSALSPDVSLGLIDGFLWGFSEIARTETNLSQELRSQKLNRLIGLCAARGQKVQSLHRAAMEIPTLAPRGDDVSVDALSKLVEHQSEHVWINAFRSIGRIGGEKATGVLKTYIACKDNQRKQIAAETLYFSLCADIVRNFHQLAVELAVENTRLSGLLRSQVFVCYSRKDEKWLERLRTMLAPLMRNKRIDLWDDTRIAAGRKWREEIEEALERAKVAVLLVSDHFLASEFINKNELPPILQAAQERGLTVLWVYISYCLYEETPIKSYQAAHRLLKPLQRFGAAKQKEVLKQVCQAIKKAVG